MLLVAEVAGPLWNLCNHCNASVASPCNDCNTSASEYLQPLQCERQRASNPLNCQSMNRLTCLLPLLLMVFLAPACAPNDAPPPPATSQNLVLLTDTALWEATELQHFQDSLATIGYRVVTSGYSGETAIELTDRLPWLLQPGVDLLLYDDRLAGAPAFDSLLRRVTLLSPHTEVQQLGRYH